MKRQLQRLGFSYPWSREIATCDPEYYRWNQWFFLRMLEKGIAYRAKAPVNWCPSCLTVLANEQAEGGSAGAARTPVEQRDMEQWFLRITAYQDALLDDMAQLPTWPERVLPAAAQLGRQVARRRGRLPGRGLTAASASSRPGSTRSAAPPSWCSRPSTRCVDGLLAGLPDAAERKQQIARLRAQDRRARLEGRVEKEGVFTGRYATNPFTKREDPGLGRQLRADGLRHRRHHVGPRARPARLRVRAQVRARGPRGDPAGRARSSTARRSRPPTTARAAW